MKTADLRKLDGPHVARCALATNAFTRMRGLLGRSELARDEGMYFNRTGSVHTAFMRFPIDVVFCDRDLVVLDVERGLQPWRTAKRRGAKVVIELADGAAAGIEPGDRLVLD